MSERTLRIVHDLATVDAADWDALAGDDNPFVEHAFLAWLEESGSATAETGWMPAHVVVHEGGDASGRILAAAPTYVKSDSYGEYIFDWAWADACRRAGISYYPKIVVAVPFTPATGPRALVHPDAPEAACLDALGAGVRALADAVEASSVHWLFTPEDQAEALSTRGFRHRLSHQYHWEDLGFGDFDGYLAAMTSKRRKEVRRERRQAAAEGLDLAVESVADLTPDDLAALYRCYRATIDTRWAQAYLTEAWWRGLPEHLGHRGLVATARDGGRLVAASLAFQKGDQLFGRYWGSTVDVPALHFELCYYRFVEHALERGLRRFEAGAQGRHKIQRGFLPQLTHSAHWIRHPGLDDAVGGFLAEEAAHEREAVRVLSTEGPFKDPPPLERS